MIIKVDSATDLFRKECLMSRNEDGMETQQPAELIVLNDFLARVLEEILGFSLVDVHSNSPEFALLETLDESARINEASSRGIDEDDALFHFSDAVLVDNVLCRIEEWTMDGDNVGSSEKFIQLLNICDAILISILCGIRIVRNDGCTKSMSKNLPSA